ncbi:methyl-accepting chemotaxis protein [bacterium]|nr:methyl-accepting chemotaxis protein [bacterium]
MKIKFQLTQKLMLMMFAILVISMTGVTVISVLQSEKYLTELAKSDLSHLTSMATNACLVSAERATAAVKADLASTRRVFDEQGGDNVVVQDGVMYAGGIGDGWIVNDNTEFVDWVREKTGAYCTIFMKEGERARRIATSVADKDGKRAVGTYISQDVYDVVFRSGKPYYGRAFVVDRWLVTAYEPIRDQSGAIVGSYFVGVEERTPALRAGMLSQKVGETGYIYTMNSKGILQVHPAKEGADLSGYDFAKEMMAKAPNLAEGEIAWVYYDWINKELGETEPRTKIVAYAYFPEWDWIVAVGSYLDEFTAPVNNVRNAIIWLGLLCLAASLIGAFFMARSIAGPVKEVAGVAELMAQGDLSKTVHVKSQDEIGVLAKSFNAMIQYLQGAAQAAERIAANDLTVEVEPRSDKDTFGHAFKKMLGNLSDMIKQLSSNAQELVSAATEIASSAEEMSRGAHDQSDQVGQVSTAIEEMNSAIAESAKNAGSVTEASKRASENASQGGMIVSETINGMHKIADVVRKSAHSIGQLAEAADQIGEIIDVIDDIADQTNLLALNAAIEAARAGEQGRGFAVVADEVRKLAERTGKATGQITEMIKGIQSQTSDAVTSMESGIKEVDSGRELADQAGASLNEIVTMTQEVMAMIQQIATATEEQSVTAESVLKNIDYISSVTKETAQGAEQSATAAEELSRQADGLNRMVEKFKLK